MRDKPTAADLLETARRVLMEELLPELPRGKRYAALMVGAAMATVGRESTAGDAPIAEEHDALIALYGDDAPLDDLNRLFAEDLRAGSFDHRQDHALAILRASVAHRLAECNPDYKT